MTKHDQDNKNTPIEIKIADDVQLFIKDLSKSLTRYLHYRLKLSIEDAEDIASIAMVKASEKVPFENQTYFRKRSYRIARNKAVDFIRRRTRYPTLSMDSEEFLDVLSNKQYSQNRPPEEFLLHKENKNILEKYLVTLNTRDKAIMGLHMEGYSDAEIVELLQIKITPKRVSNIRSEIKQMIRKQIEIDKKH